jgi:putative MATE family efflux protein
MGVEGAAIATSVGYFVQLAILLVCFVAPREHRRRYRVHRPPRPAPRQVRDIIRIGTPSAWENFVDMMGFVFFSVLIGQAGAVQLAASQITVQLLAFSFMPLWGVTIAGSVLTGNWIGAGRPDLAERYGRQVYKVGIYYALALAGLFALLRGRLFVPFTNDPAVLALGGGLALAAAFFQVWDGTRMIGSGILSGAGDTRFPMVMALIVLWGIFIPLTYVIVRVGAGGVAAAWLGGGFCYLVLGGALYLRFRSGVWKRVRIFSQDRRLDPSC